MKKIFLILIFGLVAFATAFAQDSFDLVLNKKSNNKEVVIKQGQSIKIKTNDNRIYQGSLLIANDSLLIFGTDSISIEDINIIRRKATGKGLGIVQTSFGGLVSLITSALIIAALVKGEGLAIAIIVGTSAPFAVLGFASLSAGIPLLVKSGPNRMIESKWNYSVRKNTIVYTKNK